MEMKEWLIDHFVLVDAREIMRKSFQQKRGGFKGGRGGGRGGRGRPHKRQRKD